MERKEKRKKRREEGKGKKKGNYRGRITKMAEEGKRKKEKKKGGEERQRAQRPITAGRCTRRGPAVGQRGDPEPGGGHQQTAPSGDAADPAGRPHGNAEPQNPLRYPYGRLRGGWGGARSASGTAMRERVSGTEPPAVCSASTAPHSPRNRWVH